MHTLIEIISLLSETEPGLQGNNKDISPVEKHKTASPCVCATQVRSDSAPDKLINVHKLTAIRTDIYIILICLLCILPRGY